MTLNRQKKYSTRKPGEKYEIEEQTMKLPRIKIVGVQNEMSMNDLENDINRRNFEQQNSKCKIIHIFKNRNNSQSVLAEVTSELYSDIVNSGMKLYVGHQCCRVYDDFNISPCPKCGRIGHSAKKCSNAVTCFKCGENHQTNECTANALKCANCVYQNNTYNLNRNICHALNDPEKCEYLKHRFNKVIAETSYPVRPALPTMRHP